jgi:hypothetical protein
MAAKAGDLAKKSGELVCEECEEIMYIEKGEEIPTCPCGGETFQESVSEPSTPKSKKNR